MLKLLWTASSESGVLQLEEQLINVAEATICWTWVNRFSMIKSTAGVGEFFSWVGNAKTAGVLLQQPVLDPSSAAIGHKPLAKSLPLKECEATAAGDNGTHSMPKQLVGVATVRMHKSSTVSVFMPAIYVDWRACADNH